MLKRFLLVFVFTAPLCAQSPGVLSVPLTATATTCATPVTTACVSVPTAGLTYVAVQLEGTWSGTVTFEATVAGTTWVALSMTPIGTTTPASTTTGNGIWTTQVPGGIGGVTAVRARVSAYASGTITASIQAAH